jgi:hypothetical protein
MAISNRSSTEPPPNITSHARARWAARTPVSDPIALRRAWARALEVRAPEVDGEAVRLYPPYGLLLVKRDGVLRTVLCADYGRLDARGYATCSKCGCLDDPLTGSECNWCGAPDLTGAITVTRGGEST